MALGVFGWGVVCEWGWLRPLILIALWTGVAMGAVAQAAAPDTSVEDALRGLASRSDVVFVGRVMVVRPAGGVVEVVFSVEQPLLGVVGATYTLREWGGLWTGGRTRYHAGERMAIFLYAPGKGGLSSSVDGMEGILPVVQESADTEPLLDVRRVATRLLRAVGSPMVEGEAMRVADVARVVAGWKRPVGVPPVRRPLPVGMRPIVRLPGLPVGIGR